MRLLSLIMVCLLIVCAWPRAAVADDGALSPAAQEHLDRGLAHYAAHEYAAAVAEFQAGYAIEPRSDFLFAWAQAARLSGDCPAALDLYQRFLATDPPLRQAAAARTGIARCEASVAQTVAPVADAPEPEPKIEPETPTPPAPALPPTVVVERTRPWYHDRLGSALLAAGVVGLGTGITFYALSVSSADTAGVATTYAAYDEEMDRAESRRSVAVVALTAGACLVSAAAIRYMWFPERPERQTLTVWLAPQGGGVGLAGAF